MAYQKWNRGYEEVNDKPIPISEVARRLLAARQVRKTEEDFPKRGDNFVLIAKGKLEDLTLWRKT